MSYAGVRKLRQAHVFFDVMLFAERASGQQSACEWKDEVQRVQRLLRLPVEGALVKDAWQ